MAGKAARRQNDSRQRPSGADQAIEGGARGVRDLDRMIHQPIRLAIVSSLAVCPSMTFNELKAKLELSDGNLSVHARKLEAAGYVECDKGYRGRVPRTEYRISALGRRALKRYVSHMEALIEALRGS